MPQPLSCRSLSSATGGDIDIVFTHCNCSVCMVIVVSPMPNMLSMIAQSSCHQHSVYLPVIYCFNTDIEYILTVVGVVFCASEPGQSNKAVKSTSLRSPLPVLCCQTSYQLASSGQSMFYLLTNVIIIHCQCLVTYCWFLCYLQLCYIWSVSLVMSTVML